MTVYSTRTSGLERSGKIKRVPFFNNGKRVLIPVHVLSCEKDCVKKGGVMAEFHFGFEEGFCWGYIAGQESKKKELVGK